MSRSILIAVIALLGISSPSFAQKVMLGPRAGMDIGTISWDSAPPYAQKSTVLGLIGGAQLDVWFNDRIALSTGLLLDQKGWKIEGDNPGTYNNYTLDYLEIPLLLKVAFPTGDFQPYVFAGTSIGFMVVGYTNQFQSDGRNSFNNIFNIDNLLNTVNVSIVGGAGVAYSLPSGTQLFVDAGYAYGLMNILNENGVNADINSHAFLGFGPGPMPGAYKTRDISIAGGILFPI